MLAEGHVNELKIYICKPLFIAQKYGNINHPSTQNMEPVVNKLLENYMRVSQMNLKCDL